MYLILVGICDILLLALLILCILFSSWVFFRLEDVPLPQTGAKEVLVKLLASPINPSDINMIQGIFFLLVFFHIIHTKKYYM